MVIPWYTASADDLGVYADYNDLSDECKKNSIAIGVKNPTLMGKSLSGDSGLTTEIWAPRGTEPSSHISGTVQAVSAKSCNTGLGVFMALTDCMGLTNISTHWAGHPTGNYHRPTLGEHRNYFVAPAKCWLTGSYGNTFETC